MNVRLKAVFPQKDRFYKSLLTFKLIISKLCKEKIEKTYPRFLKGFYEKTYNSGYGYFFAIRPCRKRPQVCEKI